MEERFGLIKNTAVIWYIGHMPYFHLQTSLFSRPKDYRIWPWKKVVWKLLWALRAQDNSMRDRIRTLLGHVSQCSAQGPGPLLENIFM